MLYDLGISVGRFIGSILMVAVYIALFFILFYYSDKMKEIIFEILGIIWFISMEFVFFLFIPKLLFDVYQWQMFLLIFFVDYILLLISASVTNRKSSNIRRKSKEKKIENQYFLLDKKFPIVAPFFILILVMGGVFLLSGLNYFTESYDIEFQSRFIVIGMFIVTSTIFLVYSFRNLKIIRQPHIDTSVRMDFIEVIAYSIFRLSIISYLITWVRDNKLQDVLFNIGPISFYRIYWILLLTIVLFLFILRLIYIGEKKTNDSLIVFNTSKLKFLSDINTIVVLRHPRKSKEEIKKQLSKNIDSQNEIVIDFISKIKENFSFVLLNNFHYRNIAQIYLVENKYNFIRQHVYDNLPNFYDDNFVQELYVLLYEFLAKSTKINREEKDEVISYIGACLNFIDFEYELNQFFLDKKYEIECMKHEELIEKFDFIFTNNKIPEIQEKCKTIFDEDFFDIISADCNYILEYIKFLDAMQNELLLIDSKHKSLYDNLLHIKNWFTIQLVLTKNELTYLEKKELVPGNIKTIAAVVWFIFSIAIGVIIKVLIT